MTINMNSHWTLTSREQLLTQHFSDEGVPIMCYKPNVLSTNERQYGNTKRYWETSTARRW